MHLRRPFGELINEVEIPGVIPCFPGLKRMELYRIKKVFPAFGIVLSELLLDLRNQFAVKLAAHRFREQCVN